MSSGSVCCPPSSSSALFHVFGMLESAAEQMMVHRDFQAAFDTCERGLERIGTMEQEDNRCGYSQHLSRPPCRWIVTHYVLLCSVSSDAQRLKPVSAS